MRNAREVARQLAFYKHLWRNSANKREVIFYYNPFTKWFGVECPEYENHLAPSKPRIAVCFPAHFRCAREFGAQIARDLKAQAKAA